MALETIISISARFEDARGVSVGYSVSRKKITSTFANRKAVKLVQTVGTAEEALNLGDLTGATIKYVFLRNLDYTNYIQLRKATGEAACMRLEADVNQDGTGGVAVIPWESGVTAPFVIANTAACDLEILIIPN